MQRHLHGALAIVGVQVYRCHACTSLMPAATAIRYAHHSTTAGAGASAKERAQAGVNQDPASVPGDAPGLAGKTNWNQS